MMRQIHIPTDMDPPPYPHEMFAAKAVSRIRYELKKANKIKQFLVVFKSGKVLALK